MLTGYHYINLAKRRDRDLFMRWTLGAMHFEEHEINRFDAINGKRYKSHESIARAATQEFPFFRALIKEPIRDYHSHVPNNPTNIAIQWTWCRLLKMLSKTLAKGDFALCGTDEINLTRLKSDFERIIETLPDLDILQVCWGTPEPRQDRTDARYRYRERRNQRQHALDTPTRRHWRPTFDAEQRRRKTMAQLDSRDPRIVL